MDNQTEAFLRVLNSEDTTTGGGTASAIAGAMAAALVAMVARLSVGKGFGEPDEFYFELASEAESLSAQLLEGGHLDSQAFEALRAAYRLSKQTEEQKAERNGAIHQSVLNAAGVPLENGQHCQRVLELCAELRERSNPRAASDLVCARHLARAGLLGCIANVEANLAAVQNQALRADLRSSARRLRELAAKQEGGITDTGGDSER